MWSRFGWIICLCLGVGFLSWQIVWGIDNIEHNSPNIDLGGLEIIESTAVNPKSGVSTGGTFFTPTENRTQYSYIPFFNQIVHTSYATLDTAQGLVSLTGHIIDYINAADATLDICVYNISDAVFVAALINAHNRGVQVRIITEHDNLNSQTTALTSAGIPVIDDAYGSNSGSSLMHNKFMVVDYLGTGDSANTVWTGSMNWTTTMNTTDANNGITIKSQGVAGAYTTEFNEMWGSSGATPNSSLSKFGYRKSDNITHLFTIDGHQVGVYMSPSDHVETAINNAIAAANYDIAFCILAFTRDDIMLSMKAKWDDNLNYPDFQVEGIFDSQNAGSSYSQWWNMSGSGSIPWSPPADVSKDSLSPASALLHHKYMVIDGDHPDSDPIVITGSDNWSNNAMENNDENILVIHDTRLANLYLQEFRARKSQCMGNVPPIYDLQYPQPGGSASPYSGQTVKITGVVTASFPDASHRKYMIQGSHSSPWWGIYVYQNGTGSNFVVGDSVLVRGTVTEYYGLTEITNPTFTARGTALFLPNPVNVSTAQVSTMESLESVLVQVQDITVVSGPNGNGEWQVDDGSGLCWVDDMGTYSFIPQVGNHIAQLRGVVYYGFDAFKIEPRNDNDFTLVTPKVERLTILKLSNHIVLQWESLSGSTLYKIYASTDSRFTPSPSNQVGSTTNTQWADPNVIINNTMKFYRVVATY
jgi:phosphatidylserine/phosphatidylglycerophosphate/cardiolipin synthase-like enzyme